MNGVETNAQQWINFGAKNQEKNQVHKKQLFWKHLCMSNMNFGNVKMSKMHISSDATDSSGVNPLSSDTDSL